MKSPIDLKQVQDKAPVQVYSFLPAHYLVCFLKNMQSHPPHSSLGLL